ncbi:hypothetical protein CW304_29275 [Bacillus sp. UFRGS-B20]|nr:hypothetical protein CW304_29275 [Bacillus sp. UFRGS-B20]
MMGSFSFIKLRFTTQSLLWEKVFIFHSKQNYDVCILFQNLSLALFSCPKRSSWDRVTMPLFLNTINSTQIISPPSTGDSSPL